MKNMLMEFFNISFYSWHLVLYFWQFWDSILEVNSFLVLYIKKKEWLQEGLIESSCVRITNWKFIFSLNPVIYAYFDPRANQLPGSVWLQDMCVLQSAAPEAVTLLWQVAQQKKQTSWPLTSVMETKHFNQSWHAGTKYLTSICLLRVDVKTLNVKYFIF